LGTIGKKKHVSDIWESSDLWELGVVVFRPGRVMVRHNANCEMCSIEDINTHCLAEFRKHWTCLDNNNQQLWQCRPAEWKLNKCVFENLVYISPYTSNELEPALSRPKSFGRRLLMNCVFRNLRKLSQTHQKTKSRYTSGRSSNMPITGRKGFECRKKELLVDDSEVVCT
jgi:hypothetical protein